MAIIAPFRGITYDFKKTQDISKLVTPPYDVISEAEQEEYYQADPHNIIRLILGKRKIGDTDWDNRYTRAAECLRKWEAEGVLTREDQPCMYLTSLTYDPGNGDEIRTRWGLIALAKIEDEGSGVILPHEKTFSAHKDDRLKLYRACNAQFSQIFGLYEDPENAVLEACKKAINGDPQISFDFKDGTTHRMWLIESPALFRTVAKEMSQKAIFIADGHHRYETSRNYRNIMRERYGRKPEAKSYEFVMMYLSNMNDEGLTILPSHRLVKKAPDFHLEGFLNNLKNWFHISDYPYEDSSISMRCADLKAKVTEADRTNTAMAFCLHNHRRYYVLTLKEDAREKMAEDLHPSLKKLDVLVLSELVFKEALGFTNQDMDNSGIFHYQSKMETALSEVESGNIQMAFMLNPTKIEHVREVAGNSLVMPRKSTYFYPKVITGLVFNKLDPNEIIQVP